MSGVLKRSSRQLWPAPYIKNYLGVDIEMSAQPFWLCTLTIEKTIVRNGEYYYSTGTTFSACGPLSPSVTLNSTF